MIQEFLTITKNERIAKDVYLAILSGDTSAISAPGQFINIKIDGLYLRRPISICDYDDKTITIIYKVVGKGTQIMSSLPIGTKLDTLVGLGNGFDVSKSDARPLLIGGGVGVPPLYNLAKKLCQNGSKPIVVLGFNSKDDVFFENEFKEFASEVYVATADGSYGTKGFVTDVIKEKVSDYTYFYTCGPMPMFEALRNVLTTKGQYSFEERMGCGFGACMGCSCKTKYKTKRICVDGPVLESEEIVW